MYLVVYLKRKTLRSDHFDPYAVGDDVDDPSVKAINSILIHLHDVDAQLNKVSKKLNIKDQSDNSSVDDLEIESK